MPKDSSNSDSNKSGMPSDVMDGTTLSINAVLDVLSNDERRMVLLYLQDCEEGVASIEDVVSHLVTLKAKREGARPAHDNIEASLLHLHLPKMADVGILEYDERSEQLRYYSDDLLETWLEKVEAVKERK